MKIYRLLVLVGGVLLIIGAALPWESSYSCFTFSGKCESGSSSGLALSRASGWGMGSSVYTAAGGGILVCIALIDKGRPGKTYSKLAIVVSVLCGLLLVGTAFLISTSFVADVSFSPAYGLLCVSPLGALLGILGGRLHVPQEEPQAVATWWVVLAFVVIIVVLVLSLTVLGPITGTPFSTINHSLNSLSPIPTPTLSPTATLGPTPTLPPAVVELADFGIISRHPCGAPCFLGIRPGVTTTVEAARILKKAGIPCEVNRGLCQFGISMISVSGGPSVARIDLEPPVRITIDEFKAQYGPPDWVVADTGVPTFFFERVHTMVFLFWQEDRRSYAVTPDKAISSVSYLTADEYQHWIRNAGSYLQPWKGYGTYFPSTTPTP